MVIQVVRSIRKPSYSVPDARAGETGHRKCGQPMVPFGPRAQAGPPLPQTPDTAPAEVRLSPARTAEPPPADGVVRAGTDSRLSQRSQVDEQGKRKAPRPPKRHGRGAPFGWMSIVCACLSALLLSLVFLFFSLPVIVIPFGVQEPMWLYADDRSAPFEVLYVIPLLWVAAIVFGIVAVRRGDRRRGIAGLMLCGLEVALGVNVVCLGCMLLTIAG
jgi:hypothetical protein